MRRLAALLLCLALVFSLSSAWAAGPNGRVEVSLFDQAEGVYRPLSAHVIALTLDGAPLPSKDVPALIWRDRTMVPVRLAAEAMGAQVIWVKETGQVVLRRGETKATLTLGSATADVNGRQMPLPDGVPAAVMRYQGADRTMVPVRFVTETLGGEVSWQQSSFTAALTSPTTPVTKTVSSVEADSQAQSILISTNHVPTYQVWDLGDRVAVDIQGAVLASGQGGQLAVGHEFVSSVRFAQHGSSLYPQHANTVRVVLDLRSGATYAGNVAVAQVDEGVLVTTFPEAQFELPTPIAPHKKTVVLDPGHGGAQSGAYYGGIAEKTINLAVSQKLRTILEGLGYQVIMTRTTDAAVGLTKRASIANTARADLFVSIHSNAAENNSAFQGIYTYYHPTSRRGARLAQAIQDDLVRATGGIDRGIRSADFVVLRETNMCAALVELGFMSSREELSLLTDPAYQDKLAQGVAAGIIRYLNSIS